MCTCWSIGHFLLTNLLLTDLKNAAADGGDARVVVVTSSLHDATAKSCRSASKLLCLSCCLYCCVCACMLNHPSDINKTFSSRGQVLDWYA